MLGRQPVFRRAVVIIFSRKGNGDMKKKIWIPAAALFIVTFLFGGCGGGSSDGSSVTIPSAYQGTWIVAAYNSGDVLGGVGLFSIDSTGALTVIQSGGIVVTGSVTEGGVLTFNASPPSGAVTSTGNLLTNDTGSGTWTQQGTGNSGTFQVWRANGGAYAGTWALSVDSGTYTGTVTVDSNGVINGTLDLPASLTATIIGVVTGTGTIITSWSYDPGTGSVTSLGDAPASGTASGSTASGNWADNEGNSGTWIATKN